MHTNHFLAAIGLCTKTATSLSAVAFQHRAEVIQGVSRAKPLLRVPDHGGRPRRVARRDRRRAKLFDSMTLYRWPLGDWPELPLPEGSDWLPPLDRAPVGARFPWLARPSVDWPAPAPAWPWPEERSRTFAPAPTLSRVVLEAPAVVDVRLRTVVRVDTPPPTATPARRFLTMTALEGSR